MIIVARYEIPRASEMFPEKVIEELIWPRMTVALNTSYNSYPNSFIILNSMENDSESLAPRLSIRIEIVYGSLGRGTAGFVVTAPGRIARSTPSGRGCTGNVMMAELSERSVSGIA